MVNGLQCDVSCLMFFCCCLFVVCLLFVAFVFVRSLCVVCRYCCLLFVEFRLRLSGAWCCCCVLCGVRCASVSVVVCCIMCVLLRGLVCAA